jgi:hypothetical protein
VRLLIPIIAFLLSGIGIFRSIRRRVRFVMNPGYRGWIDTDSIPPHRLDAMYFCVEYLGVKHYTFTRMYMPRWIGDVYMDKVRFRIRDNYRTELKGGRMYVEYDVPRCVTVECNGYTMIREEHQLDTFLRKSGVRQQTLIAVMNDYRRTMYRELVKDGMMKESDLK